MHLYRIQLQLHTCRTSTCDLRMFSLQVEEEELIKNDSKCKDYLIEALKYHLLKKGNDSYSIVTPRTKRRTPVGLPKVGTKPRVSHKQPE